MRNQPNKRIPLAIIGPYPPPYGGIATHIYRLRPYLKSENISHRVFNHGNAESEDVIPNHKSPIWYFDFLFCRNLNVNAVHFHQTLHGFEYLYWFIYSKINRLKIIITLHNETILSKRLFRSFNLFLLRKTGYSLLITVSKKVHLFLNDRNIRNILLPAYIPVDMKQLKPIRVDKRKKIIVYAIFKVTSKNLIDIYGFDLVMKLMNFVSGEYDLYILIGDKKNSDIGILESILFQNKQTDSVNIVYDKNLVDFLPNADVYIRPSKSDGYGISIQEALELGVPAIASDVCERPPGTIVFKSGSFEDFFKKFNFVARTPTSEILKNSRHLAYHRQLITLYKRICQPTHR